MSSNILFKSHDDRAIIPNRAGSQEVGYDLTIIEKVKDLSSNTAMYDSYISVQPPNGIYFEIVPRSSISKTGYILTNSIGIIDPSYRGTLKVVLTKIDDTKPDLELPNKRFQLIPRTFISNMFDVDSVNELSNTERGDRGFGSTDLNN
jgi:dUTP pyrophosphatase